MPGDAAPPSVSGSSDSVLEELRRSIDVLDDRLHDLVIERARVVERIGAAKRAAGQENGPQGAACQGVASQGGAPVFVRPGREMAILRRLLARHSGPFPRAVVVRMWREMFAGTLTVQNPLNVAVYMPVRGAGYLEIARDQYGAYTRMDPMQTPGAVVRAVAEGQATIGVLPLPMLEEGQKWWSMLVSDVPGTPRVISRLPICGPGAGRGDGAEALSIGRMAQEPTGDDRTLLVVETRPELSRAGLKALVEQAGLPVQELVDTDEPHAGDRHHLLELNAYVAPDDPRVATLGLDAQVARAMIVGGYAVPLSADDLA